MKKVSLLLALAAFLSLSCTADAAMDLSVFQTRGFEGKGELEFNQPEDILVAPDGNIVIADTNNNRLQVLGPHGDFLRIIPPPKPKNEALTATAVDTRPANVIKFQNTSFKRPVGLAFGPDGKLYCSLSTQDHIAVIDYATGNLERVFGGNGKALGQLYMPMDIDIDDQNRLAVAEFRNRRVQIFNTDGVALREIIYQEEHAKGGFRRLEPRGVFWTKDGDLIVTYPNYHQIVCWNVNDSSIKWRYGGNKAGNEKGMLNNPSFVAQGQENHLIVSDTKNGRILEITREGKFYEHHSRKGSAPGKLNTPRGIFLTKDDTLIISDSGNSRVQFFSPGQASVLLKEAKTFALQDDWQAVMSNAEKILYLQPNNEQAIDLMVNAYYYFGDKAFKDKEYDKAEDYYRRVLRYKPDDGNIPQKLDAIFWENNRPYIVTGIAIIIGFIALIVFGWVLKLVFKAIRRRAKND